MVNLAVLSLVLLILPLERVPSACVSGRPDLLAYLLVLGRFHGAGGVGYRSSFEGMGASRELQFAVFAEPALLVGLGAGPRWTNASSLSGMLADLSPAFGGDSLLACVAGLRLSRFVSHRKLSHSRDDPTTHLN